MRTKGQPFVFLVFEVLLYDLALSFHQKCWTKLRWQHVLALPRDMFALVLASHITFNGCVLLSGWYKSFSQRFKLLDTSFLFHRRVSLKRSIS